MSLLDKLEQKLGKLAIPNLTYYLIIGQVITFLAVALSPAYASLLALRGDLVLAGQWWRVFSFLLAPLTGSFLFIALIWYFYYLLGTVLEQKWGAFRYTLYLFIAWVATIVSALLFPRETFSNGLIFGSVFLAFAYLYPDYPVYLFFILPVKVKWLALLIWLGIAAAVLFGSLPTKVLAILSVGNFALFFGREIALSLGVRNSRLAQGVEKLAENKQVYLTCAVCDARDKQKVFYYCDKCVPETRYCEDHIQAHKHKGKSKVNGERKV